MAGDDNPAVPDLASFDDDACVEGAGGVDCSAVFAKLDLILDRELPASELANMESHLTACLPCADRAEFETKLRAVIRDRAAEPAPAGLVRRIRDALQLPVA